MIRDTEHVCMPAEEPAGGRNRDITDAAAMPECMDQFLRVLLSSPAENGSELLPIVLPFGVNNQIPNSASLLEEMCTSFSQKTDQMIG
jgi:hypothetical protein